MILEKFAEKEEWKKFVRGYVVPLNNSAENLIRYWEYLQKCVHNKPIEEIEKDENLKTILLGGIEENGDYTDRSLALFYKKFFGAQLSNLHEYLISRKEGVTPQVTGAIEESEFMKFAKNISEKTDAIHKSAYQNGLVDAVDSEVPEIDFEEIIKEPKKVAELIKDFYDNTLKITVNYNRYTLFLWTIRKITKRYFEAAYPELKDESKFNALKNLVGLGKYFEPEIEERTENDRKVKRDYTVWHLPDNSFGGMICGLNEIVWEHFEKEDFREDLKFLFGEITSLREEWVKMAGKTLNDINWNRRNLESIPSYPDGRCRICDKTGESYMYCYDFNYSISKILINSISHRIRLLSGSYGDRIHEVAISLFKLFDDLSPALFLGIIDPAEFGIRDNVLELKQIGGD